MADPASGNTALVDVTTDGSVDPAARAASRTTDGRQRVLAALVVAAAALLAYSLSGGPWARATVGDDGTGSDSGSGSTQVELRLSGEVDVDPGDGAVAGDLDRSAPERQALEESTNGATRDLTQVLAVLVLLVAAVGLVVDLRSRLWGLLASASLVTLLAAAVLRDAAMSALARGLTDLDAGAVAVDPTGWSGLALGAAATAALAAFLATAERGVAGRSAAPVFGPDAATPPAERRRPSTPAGRVRARLLNSLPSRER
jgi:hypothetical protein